MSILFRRISPLVIAHNALYIINNLLALQQAQLNHNSHVTSVLACTSPRDSAVNLTNHLESE
jgi:hypothetical protein